jgi:hypothetical protein
VEHDLVATRAREVTSRFELAATRIADGWLRARRVRVSLADFRIASQFLERDGWKVEELPGLRVRLSHRDVREETTREEAVMAAFRRLVAPSEGPALAVHGGARRRAAGPPPVRISLPAPLRVSGRAHTAADACPAESPA